MIVFRLPLSLCPSILLYFFLAYSMYPSRRSLLRQLAIKSSEDEILLESDKSHWYAVTEDERSSEMIRFFAQLSYDDDSARFVEQSVEKSDQILTQIWHAVAQTFLSFFYSPTDVNGMLRRGSMFVLSTEQFKTLLSRSLDNENQKFESLMDLGAGDGATTSRLAPVFDSVFVTETSSSMRARLSEKRFTVLDVETWHVDRNFDVISCLNVLDRCERPLSLIRMAKRALKPKGLFIVALVFPFRPYVEFGGTGDHEPLEKLQIDTESGFMGHVNSVVKIFQNEEIGVGLTGFGVTFLFLGVLFLFDKGLLAIGNILFISGLAFVIGLERTFRFFFQWHKAKGSISFFGGIFVVLFGYPIIGMCIELYGFVVLFSGFFPVAINFLRRIPVIGSILSLPGISTIANKIAGEDQTL